jgi:hypothetical protein
MQNTTQIGAQIEAEGSSHSETADPTHELHAAPLDEAPIDPHQRKAAIRKKYDEKRAEEFFLLGVHLPKAWREPELGPALRGFISALIAAERRKNHRKHSVRKLILRATAELNEDGGKAQPAKKAASLDAQGE